jgi:hypothetical protein
VAQEKALELSRYAEFHSATQALPGGRIVVHSHSSRQASPCRQSNAFSLFPCIRVLDHGQKGLSQHLRLANYGAGLGNTAFRCALHELV